MAWIENESALPCLELNLDLPIEEVQKELVNIYELFNNRSDHRVEEKHKGWWSVCLYGLSTHQTRSPIHYGYKSDAEAPYKWTELSEMCPVTVNAIKNTFKVGKFYRIRLMILEPGGYILPHKDMEKSSLPKSVNVAITNPPGAYFFLKDTGIVPFEEGKAFKIDISIEHSVINIAEDRRVHLMVHYDEPLPEWETLVVNSYRKNILNCE